MKYILFLVSFIFSSTFYFFSTINTSTNKFDAINKGKFYYLQTFIDLKLLSIIFLLIAFFFFLYFSDIINLKGKSEKRLDYKKIPIYVKNFFKSYIYYIGIILFYFSIYFILKDTSIFKPNLFIFILNLIIIVLFFLTKKFFIFKDFIKINTIFFSLFYLGSYIYFCYLGKGINSPLDLFNQISIFFFFLLTIYNDKVLLKKDFADTPLILYFFIYIFGFIYFYLKLVGDSFKVISFLGFFLSVFLYYILVKVKFFTKNILILKYLSIIFLYISTIASMIYSIKVGTSIFLLFIILYSSGFNFIIHMRYQNYISFFFSISSLIFFIYYVFFKYFSDKSITIFLIISVLISFSMILFTYFYKIKYYVDYYFIHIFSYIINIISILYFFFQSSFDFLTFGVILLLESIFIFFSYYRFKTIKIMINKKSSSS